MQIHIPQTSLSFVVHGTHFGVMDPGESYDYHYHKMFEILYCRSGSVTEWINDHELRMEAGDWLFLNSGVRHRSRNGTGKPYEYISIQFDTDLPQLRHILMVPEAGFVPAHAAAEQKMLPAFVQNLLALAAPLIANDASPSSRHVMSLEISPTEILLQYANILLMVQAFLDINQEHIMRRQEMQKKGVTDSELQIANRMAALLDEGANTAVTISGIAGELNLSRSQCSKVFTKVYGLSPRQYLTKIKLLKAQSLLWAGEWSVSDISQQLGFSSVYHFSRQFRKWTGASPTKFRPRHSGFSLPHPMHRHPEP